MDLNKDRILGIMEEYGLSDRTFLRECVLLCCVIIGSGTVEKHGSLHESALISTANHYAIRARLGSILQHLQHNSEEMQIVLSELRKAVIHGRP
jgi:hypothetical protein